MADVSRRKEGPIASLEFFILCCRYPRAIEPPVHLPGQREDFLARILDDLETGLLVEMDIRPGIRSQFDYFPDGEEALFLDAPQLLEDE